MRRRDEILRIVRSTAVHSQDELMAVLRRRGFRVTQPTLSRDVRDLDLVKDRNRYVPRTELQAAGAAHQLPQAPQPATRLDQLIDEFVLFAEAANNLVVIRTPAASAQPLASAIDGSNLEDALGTIGGDDTIFVAFRTNTAASAFAKHIQEITGQPATRRRAR